MTTSELGLAAGGEAGLLDEGLDLLQSEVVYSNGAAEGMPVSLSCRETLRCLEQAPLSSVKELSDMYGRSVTVFHRGLSQLLEKGIVERVDMGAARGRKWRWHVSTEFSRQVGAGFGLWHDEWALCRLVERLPVVEGVYEAVGAVPGLGALRKFQWFGRAVWDAAALYERGWVVFLWTGLWQDEGRLRKLMSRLGEDARRLGAFGKPAWPAAVCFVAHDQWQRELVFRAARRERLSNVAVWCMADGEWSGTVEPEVSRGWVAEFVYEREVVPGGWRRRRDDNVWNVVYGKTAWRGLLAVAEWDRITWGGVRSLVGETKDGRRALTYLHEMVERGYFERRWDGKKFRYSGSVKLRRLMAVLDRVKRSSLPGGYGRSLGADERGIEAHEDGVLYVMSRFMEVGRASASGWRSWEHLGGGGGLAPDGMVELRQSPYGPGWHYVEYERRARGKVRVGKKLRGYVAGARQDDWPVLFVVQNEIMEETCHEVGQELGVRMLTTTMSRLRKNGGPLGRGVWSLYGEDATVG